MSEHIDHHCGVAALVDLDRKNQRDLIPDIVTIIQQLQNRGDLGAGIAFIKKIADEAGALGILKGPGKVEDVFSPFHLLQQNVHTYAGAIAHTRYATDVGSFHPLDFQKFAYAFNGNIPDYQAELAFLAKQKITPRIEGDTELMGQLLLWSLREHTRNDMARVFKKAFETLEGSFNPVVLMKDAGYALRDRWGRHPLVYAQNGSRVAVASEDIAIRMLWPDAKIRDVKPGQMIEMNRKEGKVEVHKIWEPRRIGCFIEKVYFADHRSRIDGVSVSNTRYECGEILGEQDLEWVQEKVKDKPMEEWLIVVCVPESAKTAARGMADHLDLSNVEAIKRKKKAGRTFIKKTQEEREKGAREKYTYDKKLLNGRPVILVDDSMIRGTTMREIVKKLRESGATEVHVRFASPPIMGPCFYGIDFPTVQELIARKYAGNAEFLPDGTLPLEILQAIAADIGADSVKFLPLSQMARAMGEKDDSTICMSCVTCHHQGPKGDALYQLAVKNGEQS